ncbi:hypothetical protein Tco_0172941 [Tanacetum coccineum]
MENLHKIKHELEIDFRKSLSKLDPILKLNDLARKKRKHADDIHDYFRSTKRYKSSVQYEDHPTGTMLNEPYLGPGHDDHARTFSSLLLAKVDKRNLNPLKQMKAIEQLWQGCEAIENGLIEYFNSVIVSVRKKPLLTMLEAIRVIVLERMNKIREISRKWNLGHVIPVGGNIFEVRSGSEGFTINEGKKTCSYRMWPLSGIPCVYATKPGQSMYSTVLPSKPKKMPDRPRKKRIISKGEGGSSTRVSKIGSQGSFLNFKNVGTTKQVTKNQYLNKHQNLKECQGSAVVGGSRKGGAGGSKQSSAGAGRSKGGASASGSKRKAMSSVGHKKRQGKKRLGTSKFARWFGLQDEPMHTQDDPVQTQADPV